MSVLLAPVLYDAGNSISSRCWKINLDRAFPFLLRIRTHPGKPELPERGRSGRNRHPRVLPRPSPSRSAPAPSCQRRKLAALNNEMAWCLGSDPPTGAVTPPVPSLRALAGPSSWKGNLAEGASPLAKDPHSWRYQRSAPRDQAWAMGQLLR